MDIPVEATSGYTLSLDELVIWSLFVTHAVVVVFVGSGYLFAKTFLGERFYLPLGLGWILNSLYLVPEVYSLFHRDEFLLEVLTLFLALLSTTFFHVGGLIGLQPSIAFKSHLKTVIKSSLSVLGVSFAIWIGIRELNIPILPILSLPVLLYSSGVLMLIAFVFSIKFDENVYGAYSNILSGSWALYAILQLFYPLKYVQGDLVRIDHSSPPETQVLYMLFTVSFLLKLGGSIGLLNLLRQEYVALTVQKRETSVLGDIGDFVAGLYHDITRPLGSLRSQIKELSQKRAVDDVVQQSINQMQLPFRAIDAAIRVIDLLRVDENKVAETFRRTSIRASIENAIGIFRKSIPTSEMRILQKIESVIYVRGSQLLLAEAFVNVIKNAFEANASLLVIKSRWLSENSHAVDLVFQNDGDPMSPEQLKLCKRPGWSTKRQTELKANVGMGLYMATKLLGMHQGDINIANRKDEVGVEVSITLPVS